ncbi:beta strand repeat-containing protein, partial [Bradyrhizobium sp.]|uniref:beta strand repeat-containing protein n=1 Tax=Bradyrhizobium sp. TaxID=376 RepID=UPI003C74753E
MNYSGKFDAKVPADGSGLHSSGHVHVETVHATHAPADAIVVPDAQLLFNGEFKRSGVDLILSRNDQEQVFHDYFKGEKRAALSSPDGAHLTGDLVNALAGHVEYAQADGSTSVSKVIGHVSKLVGTATAIRNGVSVILNNGDNVEKGDVVQSGSNSTLGITFIDGTVFGLSSNARMVLNEMVYDPNGSNNSSLLSLVAGTISFVAGETAKHGDMKVDTPVATMGIRGTAVLVEIDFTVPGQGSTPDAKFQVLVEPDGTTGSYILFDKTTLTPLAVVDKAGQQINISNGILSQTTNPLSPELQKLITDVFSLKFSDNSNPNTNTHFTDSIVPQALAPIKLASGATATPFILNVNDTPNNSLPSPGLNPPLVPHIDQPPQVVASGKSFTVHTGTAKSTGVDTVFGPIRFTDINAGDRPTVTTHFVSLKLLDAQHNDITATLASQQIAAVEAQLVVTPGPGNNNNGTATWTYSVADSAFNFLTAGETLTLNYDAVVNNNFLPFEQQAEAPFTITINGPSVVEWIHPTGDLWSVGSNWNSGTVPTAADDAIIPAEHIPGGSGLYDVKIETPAAARTLTLNANNTTGGQVINHSTLAIGETLTIFNDGVLNNLESGTVSVGGQIELLNQSSILNSGLITLGQGGDFKDQSSVSNSGTIEIAGGTLNVQVDIANSGGIIQVDGGTTLKLNGAAINGGTVNDNGPVDVTADSSINGTETNALLNNGGVMVESGVTLTLDNVTVNGTTFIDTAAGAILQIDDDTTLTLKGGATIDGGTINDGTEDGTGSIDVKDAARIDSNATLNNGRVTVESGATLTLDNVTVNGTTFTDLDTSSIIQVDDGNTLTLNGVAINGGTINDGTADGASGTIDVIGNSSINGTTTDNGDGPTTVNAILDNGGVTVESGATLTLDNVTVNGTTFTDVATSSTIQVDIGDTLTLNGVAINGGAVNDNGAIDVTADSSINGTATNALLNNGEVTVESDVTLTLDNVTVNGTTFTDTAGGAILQIGVGTTLTLEGGATIDGGTINDGTAIIDVKDAARIDSNATLNNGRVTIESGATLTLDNVTVNGTAFTGLATSSTIQVDSGDTLKLNSATISGGTVTDNGTIDIGGAVTLESGVAVNGGAMSIAKGATLDIENAVTGTGATLNGVDVMNSGTIQVDSPGAGTTIISLVLDGGTTVTGGTLLIHVGFPISSIEGAVEIGTGGATLDHVTVTNNNSLTIDDSNTLALSHVAINGGIVNDGTSDGAGGTIDVTGDSSINGITADNGDGPTTVNAILNNGEVTVESGVTLTLDNVTVNGTIFTDLDTSSIIQVDDGDMLTLNGAAIYSGTIIATGTLDLENATINGGTLGGTGTIATASGNTDSTLNGVTIASGSKVTAAVGTLDLTGIITNNGEIDATSGTLDLENATVNGGTLNVFGVMDSTGASFITNVSITNSGLIESASGTLTIDPVAGPTLTNSGTLEANGGELDITSDPVINTGILQAIDDSTLKLTTLTVTNTGG